MTPGGRLSSAAGVEWALQRRMPDAIRAGSNRQCGNSKESWSRTCHSAAVSGRMAL
jgi:hypothetical protein